MQFNLCLRMHILNWELIVWARAWVRDTSVRTDGRSVSRHFLRIFIELKPYGARLSRAPYTYYSVRALRG